MEMGAGFGPRDYYWRVRLLTRAVLFGRRSIGKKQRELLRFLGLSIIEAGAAVQAW